jgi:DNA modification methylase
MLTRELLLGDCVEVLKGLADCSVDSIVTDPPYGLSFMGKKWDYDVPSEDVWRECLRVLKPGGYLLAFAGTRTQHRMAVRIEDAGFEIRDMIAWVYGSGFPKSLDVSKAIDKAAGAEREVVGHKAVTCGTGKAFGKAVGTGHKGTVVDITAPATDAARQWQGWGTALKPALEPITVARKPLGEKTVAANVLEHGTGAINVDGCRVGFAGSNDESQMRGANDRRKKSNNETGVDKGVFMASKELMPNNASGRWPANLIHDGSDEVVGLFPVTTSGSRKGGVYHDSSQQGSSFKPSRTGMLKELNGDSGSAARFFYCAKASKQDRDEGCEHLPEHQEGLQLPRGKCPDCGTWKNAGEEQCKCGGKWEMTSNPPPKARNNHPTVKPTALMRYLCRLVTPPEGIVLDPFMGSGSTGKAALLEGFRFIGIERDEEYMKIAEARIKAQKCD